MRTKVFFLSLGLLTVVSTLLADIRSHKSMDAVAEYIANEPCDPCDIVVAFDLDNTLVHPASEIGSDQWFEHMVQQQVMNGKATAQAIQELLPLYHAIQTVIDLQATENMIPNFIEQLKQSGVFVVGLSARYHPIIDRTCAQLAPLGITFTAISDQELIIKTRIKDTIYKNGIAFCSSNNKGEVLLELLKMLGKKPKKIFFVDDKMRHVQCVEQAVREQGIDCVCIHYTQCQERVENFNVAQAEKELTELQAAFAR